MITFYRIPSESPNIRKISLMLEAIALPHKVVNIQHDEINEEFSAISPNGTFPAIADSETGAAIFESAAILLYLAEKAGKLLPTDPRGRADVIKWLSFEAANVGPTIAELHHYLLHDDGNVPDFVFQRYKNRLTNYCDILEKQLQQKAYLCDEYSIADVALAPWTVTFEDFADIDLHDYPNISKWSNGINTGQ